MTAPARLCRSKVWSGDGGASICFRRTQTDDTKWHGRRMYGRRASRGPPYVAATGDMSKLLSMPGQTAAAYFMRGADLDNLSRPGGSCCNEEAVRGVSVSS